MPEYRNSVTGVVVRVPKATGDRLTGFKPVTRAAEKPVEKTVPKTRRKKSE